MSAKKATVKKPKPNKKPKPKTIPRPKLVQRPIPDEGGRTTVYRKKATDIIISKKK